MKNLDLFFEMIDAIYYPGYASLMAEENPEKFAFEMAEFSAMMK